MADTLSREEALTVALDYAKLAKEQESSPEIQAFRSADTGTRRPLVPLKWRKVVFESVHGLSHVGPRPTAKATAQRFV